MCVFFYCRFVTDPILSQQLYSLIWLTKQCIFMHLLHSGVVKVGMDSAVNPGYVFHYINSLRIFYHGVTHYLFHNFFGCIFKLLCPPQVVSKGLLRGTWLLDACAAHWITVTPENQLRFSKMYFMWIFLTAYWAAEVKKYFQSSWLTATFDRNLTNRINRSVWLQVN